MMGQGDGWPRGPQGRLIVRLGDGLSGVEFYQQLEGRIYKIQKSELFMGRIFVLFCFFGTIC